MADEYDLGEDHDSLVLRSIDSWRKIHVSKQFISTIQIVNYIMFSVLFSSILHSKII